MRYRKVDPLGGGLRGLDGKNSTPMGCLTGSGVIFTPGGGPQVSLEKYYNGPGVELLILIFHLMFEILNINVSLMLILTWRKLTHFSKKKITLPENPYKHTTRQEIPFSSLLVLISGSIASIPPIPQVVSPIGYTSWDPVLGSHNSWVGSGVGLAVGMFCALGSLGGLVLGFVGELVLGSVKG